MERYINTYHNFLYENDEQDTNIDDEISNDIDNPKDIKYTIKYKDIPYDEKKYILLEKIKLIAQIMIFVGGIGTSFNLLFNLIKKIYTMETDIKYTMNPRSSKLKNKDNNSDIFDLDATFLNERRLSSTERKMVSNLILYIYKKVNKVKFGNIVKFINKDEKLNKLLIDCRNLLKNKNYKKLESKFLEIKKYLNTTLTTEEKNTITFIGNFLIKEMDKKFN